MSRDVKYKTTNEISTTEPKRLYLKPKQEYLMSRVIIKSAIIPNVSTSMSDMHSLHSINYEPFRQDK